MAEILFVTWWGGGNQNPLLALGAQLEDRGHRVRVLGAENLSERFDRFTRVQTARAMPTADEVQREKADLIVVDYMATDAICGALASGPPVVAFVHTLYWRMMRDGELMPMGMAGGPDVVNRRRSALGQAPVARLAEMLDECASVLVTTIAEIDEPSDQPLPLNVQYCGPLIEAPGADAGWQPPWPADDQRPLVVLALGTTPMGEETLMQRVLDAASELDVRVLVNAGDHVDVDALAVPGNAVVQRFVQHSAVLPHARAVVTHAGLGTISTALALGRPLLCVPIDRDQPGNAARVDALGAGRVVAPGADVAMYRHALDDAVYDDKYASVARTLAVKITGVVEQQVAVGAIESAL